jgi:hypothetical protein
LRTLEPGLGTYAVEWYGISIREDKEAEAVEAAGNGAQSMSFTAPFEQEGPAILYLKRKSS